MAAKSIFFDRVLTGVLLVSIAIVANVIIMRHVNGSIDLTEYQENTLAPGTIKIVKKLPDRARVKAYFSKEFPPEGAAYFERVRDLLTQIERVSDGKVVIDWLDPTKAEVAVDARKAGITPREFPIPRNDRYEQVSIYLGLDIRCADRSPKLIPFVPLDNPEYEIARALSSLAEERPTVIGFLTREPAAPPKMPGFEMPPSPERIFNTFREQLEQQFKVVDLENIKYGDPIPSDISVLVLGRPKDLTERERFEIDQYIMNGGRVLVLYDAHEHDIQGRQPYKKITTGLEPLLTKWGLAVSDNQLVADRACETLQVRMQTLNGVQPRIVQYPYWIAISQQTKGISTNHPITKRLQGMNLFWAAPIDLLPDHPQSLQFETLLQSSELANRTKEVSNIGIDEDLGRRIIRGFDKDTATPSQQKLAVAIVGKFPSAFAGKTPPALTESRPANLPKPEVDDAKRTVISESKESRIVFIGDSDFATNQMLSQSAWIFLENTIEWLSLSQDLSTIRARNQVRKIRNFEQEALKRAGVDKEMRISATTTEELEKEFTAFYDKQDYATRNARNEADAERNRIKLFFTLGPSGFLVIFGFIRMFLRRRERERLAASA